MKKIVSQDRDILRSLGERIAEIAALPQQDSIKGQQDSTKEMWRKLNSLDMDKPMVMIYQIPWGEMDYNGELALRCADPYWRTVEEGLLRRIYQWEHMRADMVMEPVVCVEPVLEGDDYGLTIEEQLIDAFPDSGIQSHHYIAQIKDETDIEKIRIPQISCDEAKTEETVKTIGDIFDGVLSVESGVPFTRYNIAPWDRLVQWTGVTEILTDLALRPDFVHRLMERLMQVFEARLDQYEKMNLLKLNNRAEIIGQGGYGYTDELPGTEYDSRNLRCSNLWGGGMAQIFSEVSPQMHEEFALDYESRCLNRFGLVYYGCCEPLHHKVDLVRRKIPRLRKISMSPKADVRKGAEAVGDSLVYSCKPNPAFLATDRWDPCAVRTDLKRKLDITTANGCNVEIILKDISTVRHEPQRLWEWASVVSELSAEYGN